MIDFAANPPTRPASDAAAKTTRPVAIWLFAMCAAVAGMVLVGGATRLTDSGLSITEWKPVTGALPPLSEAAWLTEFEKYKQIPEYERVNWGMSLSAFKTIYWWEWGHRLYGRLLGLAFLGPLVWFAATGRVGRALGVKLAGLFLLGGLQGALGWWMVASGLTERIDVSQYRLAAHLSLAVALLGAILWIALDLINPRINPLISTGKAEAAAAKRARARANSASAIGALIFMAAVYGQIVLGAFVAGLRAGKTFNTWPLMDGRFVPEGYFFGAPGLNDLFETAAATQFNHRIGAYLVCAGAVWIFMNARGTALAGRGRLILFVAGAQTVLGIVTVLTAAPIGLGLAHQAGALALFAAAVFHAHGAWSAGKTPTAQQALAA